tara:strand:- start:5166 stop:5801 length:636 start_codon:yes stop_codon:yes gene_type:complete
MKLFNYRKFYKKDSLSINDIGDNPLEFFKRWFKDANDSNEIIESNAMTLTTVEGKSPSSRVVLLKEIKDSSLVFFTNYDSNKGRAISENPNVCASFYWPPLERQVIFKGIAKKTDKDYSDSYFSSRPYKSQAAAIVSKQSEVINSYEELLDIYNKFLNKNKDFIFQRPKNWGGIEIDIKEIEFWQGRENRLHNRIICRLINDNWDIQLLSP